MQVVSREAYKKPAFSYGPYSEKCMFLDTTFTVHALAKAGHRVYSQMQEQDETSICWQLCQDHSSVTLFNILAMGTKIKLSYQFSTSNYCICKWVWSFLGQVFHMNWSESLVRHKYCLSICFVWEKADYTFPERYFTEAVNDYIPIYFSSKQNCIATVF